MEDREQGIPDKLIMFSLLCAQLGEGNDSPLFSIQCFSDSPVLICAGTARPVLYPVQVKRQLEVAEARGYFSSCHAPARPMGILSSPPAM